MARKSSFPPVIAPDTRVLVLGSLPGEKSLAAQRYYAHPQNRFWHLIGKAIGQELEPLGYEARLQALLAAKVGLWDTVGSARRRGSLDAAIREAEHNRLADLAASLPEKMSEKLGAITAFTPMSSSAQAACSRLEPQPKLSPAMMIGAPENSGRSNTLSGSCRSASKAPRPSPSRVTVLSQRAGMMRSVSAFLRPNG